MLHQRASRIGTPGLSEPVARERVDDVDRSMDILQYATAFFAIAVAVMLAVLH
jgi:hypothetical protein